MTSRSDWGGSFILLSVSEQKFVDYCKFEEKKFVDYCKFKKKKFVDHCKTSYFCSDFQRVMGL